MTGADDLGWWGVLIAVIGGAIRVSTPYLFVSLGETLTEKGGRVNLGLEGILVMGAMSGYGVAVITGEPWLGVFVAGLAGASLGLLHGLICNLLKIPARAGLLVIGGEGALVIGGVATVLVGVHLGGLPFALGVAIMGLTGAFAGGLWIGAAGALRQYRGVNETISTLLMNYIAIAIMSHLITGPIRDFEQVLKTSSWSIPESLMVGTIPGLDVHWGLAVGVIVCVLLYVVMRRMTFGFAVDILGGNQRAAQLAGLPINRMVLIC